ncbi:MAG: fasciclin domain-containing protein [Wenzhouxiangellaceae bacterium]|nr:fasciclin domain-containing protein [Wenzhouxiangellaceae bacterium]
MKALSRSFAAISLFTLAAATTQIAIADHHGSGHGKSATGKDIVETAVAAGDFSTLVAAIQAAGLVETLKGDGPFTVFAPTDSAFAAIPQERLNALLADREQLAQVLTYHVMSGKVMAADVTGLDSAETVQGSNVEISASGSGVTIDGANVVATDIEASNGVIHVIDAVIMP